MTVPPCRPAAAAVSRTTRFGCVRAVVAAAVVCGVALGIRAGAPPAAAGVASGESAPPPFTTEVIPAVDGPVVVGADPFTLAAPGLVPGQIELTTVSTRPSLVSGDRVRIDVRGLASDDSLHVTLNGRDMSVPFAPAPPRSGVWTGVVTGLQPGPATVAATAAGSHGSRTGTLMLVDHPLDGPVISGVHQEPFLCETQSSGMGTPTDADCDVPPQAHWYARSAATGQFSQLSDPYAPYPPGTATTSVGGRTVPFVVRIDSRIVNRSITHIAVLDDPHARGPGRPFAPTEWNTRLLYLFGEYCGTGYDQGVVHEKDVLGDLQGANENYTIPPFADIAGHIGEGYMVAMSSLTTLGVHCNPLLSAETTMMVKEHIIDDYGRITHTIGVGGSGGAIQQQTNANNYPGLIDAATPIVSFPDILNPLTTVLDCHLLARVFDSDPARWTAVKQTAVTGLATPQVCRDWDTGFFPVFNPGDCPSGIPADQRYEARRNPRGVRCDVQEGQRVVWGVDPATGFANRPLDNASVQYGLQALLKGQISANDFIALNRAVGGIDIEGNPTSQRTAMPAVDAQIANASGWVTGRGALDEIPIIDQSVPPIDVLPREDVHDQMRPFETRARLDAAFGSHANQAIWSVAPYPANAIDVAEQWLEALDALSAAHTELSRAQGVAEARPADAADQCRSLETGVPGPCDQGVLRHTSIRQVAGGPLTEDVIKCRQVPVRAGDYGATFTSAQLNQLRAIFPDGVCGWSQGSVGATSRSQTWLSWGDGQPGVTPVTIPYPLVRSAAAGTPSAGVAQLPNTAASSGGRMTLLVLVGAVGLAWRARRFAPPRASGVREY